MTDKRIKVTDKRIKASDERVENQPSAAENPSSPEVEAEHDYVADLQRIQAEFDNYRKRVLREQTAMVERASARLVEALLPVLDNFERAVAHDESESGIELVYKDFLKTLESEGLREIPAEGVAFDPHVHEAVESVDDPEVDHPICRTVYRRGYRLKDRILRPAMVVVARPVESDDAAKGSR